MGRVKSEYNNIVKMFNKISGSRSLYQVFSDVIECIALSIQNQFTFGKKYLKNEECYKQIIKQYSKEQVDVFVEIYAEIINLLEENPFRDLLGDLYMQLEMGSDALGQFFTPYHICQMMAETVVNEELMNEKLIKINEPSCGGGANVIALMEVLHKRGINYQEKCILVCQDLSRLTALMCYIVLSLMGCQAVVKVGDTLMNPYTNYYDELKKGSELWTTPLFHINNCYNKI